MTSHSRPARLRARALGAVVAAGALLAGLVGAPAASAATGLVTDPASYVDTFTGTGSGGAVVGTINNFPGPAAPFGMMQFSPANGNNGTGYRNGSTGLQGFALNFASQGCTAFGNFPVLPTTIDPTSSSPWSKTSSIVSSTEHGEIGYLSMDTKDNAGKTIGAQITATDRSGVAEFTFPAGTTPTVMIRSGRMNNKDAIKSSFNVNPNNKTITGWAVSKGFCSATSDNQYRVAFTATFEQPFTAYGAWDEGAGTITNKVVGTDTTDAQYAGVQKAGGYVRFAPGTTTVRMKIAMSFVGNGDLAQWSADPAGKVGGAAANLATEVPTPDFAAPGTTPYPDYQAAFDGVRQSTYDRWNALLGKIKVSDSASTRDIGTFYHSLYRAFLHPNLLDDVDGRYPGFEPFNYLAAGASGTEVPATIHKIADSNATYGLQQEHVYANFSDWDTYRSWAPLAATLEPKAASDIAQTYVLFADQWGRFPRWSIANQSTGQMSGDNATALISQVHAFGADDFATDRALHWMYDAALGAGAGVPSTGVDNLIGNVRKATRPGATEYNARGYAPQTAAFQTDHAVTGASIAQEWSIDDFAASRFAESIGQQAYPSGVPTDVVDQLGARSSYWENHINPLTGCLSPRDYAGRFPVGSDCDSTPSDFGYRGTVTGYGQVGFDEATSEQYLWLAPQDIAGLTAALGGRDVTAERLDSFMTGGYNVGANVPKMWLGNEPNFATPWIYNYLGRPWRTQEVVEDMRTQLFGTGRDGAEPGNDDLGAMSSWYVWAAMGVYPATPGTDVLTVNAPSFEKVQVSLGSGHTLTINAPAATTKRYIGGLTVNGAAQTSTAIPDGWLDHDTTLDFTMSATATDWGTSEDDAPPSFSDGSHATIAYGDPITVAPGASGTLDLAVQRVAATSSSYRLDLTGAPAGFRVTTTGPTDFDSTGHALQPLRVTVGANVVDGDYTIPVTVLTGEGEKGTTELTVRVARSGGFLAATSLQATSLTAADAGSFDGTKSLDRTLMEGAGLVAGSAVNLQQVSGQPALAGLTVTLPRVSEGMADVVVPNGQTIALQGSPTSISFLGGAKSANTSGTATVTLDNGQTATADLSFGDWVLPSSTGSKTDGTLAPYGSNLKVVWTNHRNGQGTSTDPGAYVYATAPYTAPSGRTIASVTLNGSSSDNRRVLAIAQNTPVVAGALPAQALSGTSVAAGGSLTVTGTHFVAGERVTARLGELDVVSATADATGKVTLSVPVRRLTAAGSYGLQLVGETSGAAPSDTVTVAAATWSPQISAPASVEAGSQVSFTATGFGESELVTVTLGSQTVTLVASATGTVTGSVAAPASAGSATLTLTGVSSGASTSKAITVTALTGGNGTDVPVTLSASPALVSYGQRVTLTAQVPSGTTGAVEFFDGARSLGTATIAGSKATLTIAPAAGTHPVRAAKVGSSVSSSTVSVVVVKAALSQVTVKVPKYKQRKAAKAKVTLGTLPTGQRPAGTVTVKVGKKVVASAKVAGAAKVKVKLRKKLTKKKTLTVSAVFTPADSANLLPTTSAPTTAKAKKAKSKKAAKKHKK